MSRPPPRHDDNAASQAGRPGLRAWHVFFVAALLVAPLIALVRLNPFDRPVWVFSTVSVVSVLAFLAGGLDKRRAQAGAWRLPEALLHLLELLGGWPGAFLAQRFFRHKTVKPGYRFVFWLIVLTHQYIAIDYLLGWKLIQHLRTLSGL